jgi:hypothetical protein
MAGLSFSRADTQLRSGAAPGWAISIRPARTKNGWSIGRVAVSNAPPEIARCLHSTAPISLGARQGVRSLVPAGAGRQMANLESTAQLPRRRLG